MSLVGDSVHNAVPNLQKDGTDRPVISESAPEIEHQSLTKMFGVRSESRFAVPALLGSGVRASAANSYEGVCMAKKLPNYLDGTAEFLACTSKCLLSVTFTWGENFNDGGKTFIFSVTPPPCRGTLNLKGAILPNQLHSKFAARRNESDLALNLKGLMIFRAPLIVTSACIPLL